MIHALMVSVNYADFLAHTLPLAQRIANKVTVITSWEDEATYIVADTHGADICRTDLFQTGFRKGAAIDNALSLLPLDSEDCWLLHLDADIAILDDIDLEGLDQQTLYGANRYSVQGQALWRGIMKRPKTWRKMDPCSQDAPFLTHRARRGRRIIHRGTLLPPGFFQLWHSSFIAGYPSESPDASLDDILHAKRFPNTAVLQDFGVYHLESYDHDLKANWQGRTTRRF